MRNWPKVLATCRRRQSDLDRTILFTLARNKADATLAKPFDNADLLSEVDKLLKVEA